MKTFKELKETVKATKNEEKLETAKRCLEENIDIQLISKLTGLAEKEILDIKNGK